MRNKKRLNKDLEDMKNWIKNTDGQCPWVQSDNKENKEKKIKNISARIQSRNLDSVFRIRETIQISESVSLATMLERIINRSFTEKQSVQTRVSEQEIKIETVDKKVEK